MPTPPPAIASGLRILLLLAGAAVAFVLGANVVVARAMHGHVFQELSAVPTRDVAIVPGSPTSETMVLAVLEDRATAALALYRAGRVRTILVSGTNTAADPETSATKAWLIARGVPPRDILIDEGGSRTRQTMARAAHHLNVLSAIICTEPLHMPRSLFLASRNGIDAVGFAVASDLDRSARFVSVEVMKRTLAFVEQTADPILTHLSRGPIAAN